MKQYRILTRFSQNQESKEVVELYWERLRQMSQQPFEAGDDPVRATSKWIDEVLKPSIPEIGYEVFVDDDGPSMDAWGGNPFADVIFDLYVKYKGEWRFLCNVEAWECKKYQELLECWRQSMKLRDNYLVLRFQGDLQYYYESLGVKNSVPVYRTAKHPTKKAVVGMLGAVLGIQRNDPKLDKLYREVDVRYLVKKAGTVQTSFVKGSQIDPIKKIEYLKDYAFEVYVGASVERLKEFYEAFQNPVYTPYFGKKCCVPSVPIAGDLKMLTWEEMLFTPCVEKAAK